ncbi:MAG: tripartite tricarboxylate transporter TctB family protein [Pseudomonadota bacterium]
MTLERGIATLFLAICIAYGYVAFVTMQNELLPFELNMSFLPNTLPRALSVLGAIIALVIIFTPSRPASEGGTAAEFKNVAWGNIAQTFGLLALMVAYAMTLRPLGFIASTSLFLILGGLLLGERRFVLLTGISVFAAFAVWYLVERLLEIVLRPWPAFLMTQ